MSSPPSKVKSTPRIRWGRENQDLVWSRAAVFAAAWNHMQADLIDTRGLPYTTNIGNGVIYGLDIEGTWRATPNLAIALSAFVNDSKLQSPAAPFVVVGSKQSLPNVAHNGGRLSLTWDRALDFGLFSASSSVRYVGQSSLGVGPVLDIPQGNYFVVDATGRLNWGHVAISATLDNLADRRANTFSFGNPFTVAEHEQMTPLRPRTVRVGIDCAF